MSGRGKGGKGAKYGELVKRRVHKQHVTKSDVRRLARRAGVKSIFEEVYDEARVLLRAYLKKILTHAIVYSEYANRKTVTSMDVVYALKKEGNMLYGFGA